MFREIKINHRTLPPPDDALVFKSEKIKSEYETEAGTIQVQVVRNSKITITGSFTLTGEWVQRFRNWAISDSVIVTCYYPDPDTMSNHTCQLTIDSEEHVRKAREQLGKGLYKISITLEEF